MAFVRAGLRAKMMPGQTARLDRALEDKCALQRSAWGVFLGWLWGHFQVPPLDENFVSM